MVAKSELVNMGKRFVEVQMSNVELEQDISILRKKFRDLLTTKGQPTSLADSGGPRRIPEARNIPAAVNSVAPANQN